MRRAWQAISLALAALALGCTGSAAPAAKPPLIRRPVSDLPKVGKYEPPLDFSRVAIAPPEGWILTPQGQTFLIGFRTKENDLPRITVNAEDPPPGSPQELTEETAEAQAARLDEELRKAKQKRVEEYSLPIVLGETWFIRHVRQVMGNSPCIVQSLQTIKNGRLYTVELIVEIDGPRAADYQQSLKNQRDFGYAVAANMRFARPGKTLDPPPPPPAPAAAKAGEAKPGDAKAAKVPEAPAKNPPSEAARPKTEQPAAESNTEKPAVKKVAP